MQGRKKSFTSKAERNEFLKGAPVVLWVLSPFRHCCCLFSGCDAILARGSVAVLTVWALCTTDSIRQLDAGISSSRAAIADIEAGIAARAESVAAAQASRAADVTAIENYEAKVRTPAVCQACYWRQGVVRDMDLGGWRVNLCSGPSCKSRQTRKPISAVRWRKRSTIFAVTNTK